MLLSKLKLLYKSTELYIYIVNLLGFFFFSLRNLSFYIISFSKNLSIKRLQIYKYVNTKASYSTVQYVINLLDVLVDLFLQNLILDRNLEKQNEYH